MKLDDIFTKKITVSRSLHNMLLEAWIENRRVYGVVSWNRTFADYCEYVFSAGVIRARERVEHP